MYNNSKLAFFKFANVSKPLYNKTEIQNNSDNMHQKLLKAYEEAQKNAENAFNELKLYLDQKQMDSSILPNITQNPNLVFASQQASVINKINIPEPIVNNKVDNDKILADKLCNSSWINLKTNPINLNYVINLSDVDETIYPHIDSLINVKKLVLADDFNYTINLSNLINLEELILGTYFNQVISNDMLPPNLKKLCFGTNFIKKIDSLPNSIEELVLNNRYNNKLILPDNLKILNLGDSFNYDIILPDKLEKLTIGYHYNKKLVLPNSLRFLVLGTKFNEDIILNDKLEELTIGKQFNKNLKLPDSMKVLTLTNRSILSKIVLNKNVKVNM
jgi:hypothetical protein